MLTLNAHSSWVKSIQIMTENKIVSSSLDGTIKIWDLISSECNKTFQYEDLINEIQLL
jgi:WD40 repeat protein